MPHGDDPPRPVLAPSDLPPPRLHQNQPERVRVGGRVEVREGQLMIADARAAWPLIVESASPIQTGDWVVIEGRFEAAELTDAKLCERQPAPRQGQMTGDREGIRLRAGVAKNLELRAAVCQTIRALFDAQGYLEVDTPSLVPSPGLDTYLDAFEVATDGDDPLAYLVTSPEYQMKRLLAGGLPRIFQLAHCFRRAELGRHHNPEFLMLEWYRAFATFEELIGQTEQLVRHLVMEHADSPVLRCGEHRADVTHPFLRLSVGEAFERHAALGAGEAISLASTDEDRFFRLLVERVEPALADYDRPVVLHDYPAPLASLARRRSGAPELCERFELYAAGVELCNGFGELTDPVEQRERLIADQRRRAELGKPAYPIDERFLAALEEGMPPAAGNALGIDRLVALCAGTEDIAEVQSFPWLWL